MNKISKLPHSRLARAAPKAAREPAAEGGYARGRETRQRIVEMAIHAFGQDGFEQTSTRAIAERAGVNLGALTYYFGTKEGLYRACAQHIADSIETQARPTWERLEAAMLDETLSRGDLLNLLRGLIEAASGDAIDWKSPSSWVLFVARETVEPGIAAAVFYEQLTRRSIRTLAGLIARITDRPPEAPETIIQATSMIGHLYMLGRMRRLMLHELGWTDLSDDRGEIVKSVIWKQIEAGLIANSKPPRRS